MTKKWGVLIVVSVAMFIIAIDTTMMSVTITTIAQDLNTEIQNIQFAIALYSLVMAAGMLVGGKLSTMYGAKRIFTIGMILYCIGTVIAASAINMPMLIVGWSVIEGIGAALMIPAILSFLVTTYHGKDRAHVFAIYGAIMVGGAAIGPVIGGLFTTYASWRWAFGMEAFIGAGVLANTRVLVGLEKAEIMPKVDWGGVALSCAGLLILVAGVISANVISIIIGSVLLVFFFLWERRQEHKGKETLVSPSLFMNKGFMSGTLVNHIVQIGAGAILFSIPFFLQTMLHAEAFSTGLAIMPLTLCMLALTFITARFVARLGIRYITIIGVGIMIAGLIFVANLFSPDNSIMSLAPGLAIVGVGMGIVQSQIENVTISSAKPSESNEASGLHNVFHNLGASIGTAVIGVLMLTFFLSGLVAGVNSSTILPQQDKSELTVLVSDVIKDMNTENLDIEIEDELRAYPEEYIGELDSIEADSLVNSMRRSYRILAGIFGGGLAISFLISKRKLISTTDNAA